MATRGRPTRAPRIPDDQIIDMLDALPLAATSHAPHKYPPRPGSLDPLTPRRAPPPDLAEVGARYHRFARFVAAGHTDAVVSDLTGYSPARIAAMRRSPAFMALVAHYAADVQLETQTALERTRQVGLAATEELLERLEAAPESFSNTELSYLARDFIVAPATAAAKAQNSAPASHPPVLVQFVSGASAQASSPLIDIAPSAAPPLPAPAPQGLPAE